MRDRARFLSVRVNAMTTDPGFLRMQFQAHVREAASDGIPHLAGLLLATGRDYAAH